MTSTSVDKHKVDVLQQSLITIYQNSLPFSLKALKKVSYIRKLWNERELKKWIDNAIKELEPFIPIIQKQIELHEELTSNEMEKVKTILTDLLQTLDKKKLLFDESFLTFFINQGYMTVAESFIKLVRSTDPNLTNEEIFQALRNIWIMNSLQLYWKLPLELTTPMVAYSLLYPYTDNYLDDARIDTQEKINFNARLSQALSGKTVSGETYEERRIFSLVESILKVYPKELYPEVSQNILLIHQAQIERMKQCRSDKLSDADLLHISLFKGGTSVLADACLLKGHLTKKEELFAYQYGAFLQLLDDLQDSKSDRKESSQTLFSSKQTKEELDLEIKKLLALIHTVNRPNQGDTSVQLKMKRVILNCTILMILETVGKHPDLVSSSFYKELEAISCVRLKTFSFLEIKIESLLDY